MVDFSQYVPPGVYVEDTTTPVVTTTGVPVSLITIIGPAQGYLLSTDQVSVPTANDAQHPPAPLSQDNIYPLAANGGIPAPTATKADGTPAVLGVDYAFTAPTANAYGDEVYGVIKGSAQSPGVITLTYAYTTQIYTEPQTFDDYDSIIEAYGNPFVTTNPTDPLATQVNSPLSLAAKIAFDNGANRLILCATDPAAQSLQTGMTQAYAKTLTDYRVSVIVPLFVSGPLGDPSLATFDGFKPYLDDILAHCNLATVEGFPRVALTGAVSGFGLAQGQTKGEADLATAESNKRLAVVYPSSLYIFNGYTNTSAVVDGCFLAAGCAGRLAANPVQKPLTKEVIQSFSGLPASVLKRMTKTFKDSLSKSGVMVAEINRSSQLQIRHGVTTDMSSLITRELSIVRARDVLFDSIQIGMDGSGLVGTPITANTGLTVKGAITGILERCKADGTIIDYANLKIRQQSLPNGDPSIIEVKFSYQPAVPLNYIVVSFSLDLSSGTLIVPDATDTTTTQAAPVVADSTSV